MDNPEDLQTIRHYVRLTIGDLRKIHAECHPCKTDGQGRSPNSVDDPREKEKDGSRPGKKDKDKDE